MLSDTVIIFLYFFLKYLKLDFDNLAFIQPSFINFEPFSIFPCDISDVMKVADNNQTMPPKSTWFDPKPLDGLVVYEFDQD